MHETRATFKGLCFSGEIFAITRDDMIWLGLCPHVSQSTGPFELTKAAAKQ
jgi:hypothetical protein